MASLDAPPPLVRLSSSHPQWGELDSLDEPQTEALHEFKRIIAEQGLYAPAKDGARASHDDETLLRFLRARRFVPEDALKQFKSTVEWRRDTDLDNMYDTIDVDLYEKWRKVYPQWTGRRDKRGFPVYLFEVAKLDGKTISNLHTKPEKGEEENKSKHRMLPLFALYENLTRFVLPLVSLVKPDGPALTRSVNVVDISNVTLKQFWNLKNHMQEASTLATEYYPETLESIYIIGAPSFFSVVWSWISRWFDPHTVKKIHILPSGDALFKELSKHMDEENIPEIYGGKLPFRFGMLPILEDEIQESITWKQAHTQNDNDVKTIPSGPIKWVDGTTMEARGSCAGKPRHYQIGTLAAKRSPDLMIPNAVAPSKPAESAEPKGPQEENKDSSDPVVVALAGDSEKAVVQTTNTAPVSNAVSVA